MQYFLKQNILLCFIHLHCWCNKVSVGGFNSVRDQEHSTKLKKKREAVSLSKLELNVTTSSFYLTLSQVYSWLIERNVKLPCDVVRIDGVEDMRGFLIQLQLFNSFVLLSYKLLRNPRQ